MNTSGAPTQWLIFTQGAAHDAAEEDEAHDEAVDHLQDGAQHQQHQA